MEISRIIGFSYSFCNWMAVFLKCYYDQIIDIHFFTFRVQYDFLTYLAKFQSITNIRSHFFIFISENLRPPLLDLVPRLGCELDKKTSYAQNTSRVEIITTISIENCGKNMSKIFVALYSIFYTYCYYNFNP